MLNRTQRKSSTDNWSAGLAWWPRFLPWLADAEAVVSSAVLSCLFCHQIEFAQHFQKRRVEFRRLLQHEEMTHVLDGAVVRLRGEGKDVGFVFGRPHRVLRVEDEHRHV